MENATPPTPKGRVSVAKITMKYIAVVALFGMIAIALLWINFTYIIPRCCWPKFVK